MNFTIPIEPVTKKNHSQVIMIKGKPVVLPSRPYQEYEKKCKQYMPKINEPINYPINLKCHFYKGTHRKCDLTNLLQAVCDILVKYKILEDDDYSIVSTTNGSEVFYDKENPRTEIYIEKKDL